MRRGAFLTLSEPRDYVIDDELAREPLRELGWQIDTVPWDRPGVSWGDYEVVVIRSTWDYHHRPAAFAERLAEIDSSGARLENDLATVRWNMRKTYLRDLAGRGIPIVPTTYRDRLGAGAAAGVFETVGCNEVVIKPVIGASSEGAYRLDRRSPAEHFAAVESDYADRALMAQPLVRSVAVEGEYSLFYFEGRLSHAILKKPAAGDFRAQEEHGAEVHLVDIGDDLARAGAATVGALDHTLLYVRADFVRANDEPDTFWLMELELVEPSLYLRMDAEAPRRFAAALDARMRNS